MGVVRVVNLVENEAAGEVQREGETSVSRKARPRDEAKRGVDALDLVLEGLHLCLLLGELELEVLAQLLHGAKRQCEHRERARRKEGGRTHLEALVPAFLVAEVLVLDPEALGQVGRRSEGAVARAAGRG